MSKIGNKAKTGTSKMMRTTRGIAKAKAVARTTITLSTKASLLKFLLESDARSSEGREGMFGVTVVLKGDAWALPCADQSQRQSRSCTLKKNASSFTRGVRS